MSKNTDKLVQLIKANATIPAEHHHRFYKTGPGEYAEHDKFLGVTVPTIRKLCKQFYDLSLNELKQLLQSPFNEIRLAALIILAQQYQNCSSPALIYQFYLDNIDQVNNWNLVDASAHLIIGAHLIKQAKTPLLELANSDNLWHRRIAMVATWQFIRNNQLSWTFKLAKLLLNDNEDLMHKAVGWMLREAGKKDQQQLINFLDNNAKKMPRTMLRYAIERFSKAQRQHYLQNY